MTSWAFLIKTDQPQMEGTWVGGVRISSKFKSVQLVQTNRGQTRGSKSFLRATLRKVRFLFSRCENISAVGKRKPLGPLETYRKLVGQESLLMDNPTECTLDRRL